MVKYRWRAEKFTRNCIFKATDECNIGYISLTKPASDPAINIVLITDIFGFSRGWLKQRRKLHRVQPR